MGHHLRAIRRLVILLSVWAVAAIMCSQAWAALQENREMQERLSRNQAEYDSNLSELTRLMDTRQRLETDTGTQIDLLKQKLGYCEPGEIPIIIVDKTAPNL